MSVKLNKFPGSKREPVWKTTDGRFLVMAFRAYANRHGKKSYSLTYWVSERDADGELKRDLGETTSLMKSKCLIQEAIERTTDG